MALRGFIGQEQIHQQGSWKEGKSITAYITTKYFLPTEHVAFTVKNYVPDIFLIPKAMVSQLGTPSCMSQNMNSGPHQNPSTDAVKFHKFETYENSHLQTTTTTTITTTTTKKVCVCVCVRQGLMFWHRVTFQLPGLW